MVPHSRVATFVGSESNGESDSPSSIYEPNLRFKKFYSLTGLITHLRVCNKQIGLKFSFNLNNYLYHSFYYYVYMYIYIMYGCKNIS